MSGRCCGRVCALVIVVIIASVETAVAQVYRLRVVSAECTPLGCRLTTATCTTVAIGRHRPGTEIFLSAGHCVRGNVRSAAIEVNGTWHPADVLAVSTSPERDVAVLGVQATGEVPCVPLADKPAAQGDTVVLESFPDGGAFQRRAGRVAAHAYLGVELVVGVPTRPGESGGAILDRDGRLVGIISATGPLPVPNHTLATGVRGARRLLTETFQAGVPRCGGHAVGDSERPPQSADAGTDEPDETSPADPPAADSSEREAEPCECETTEPRLAELTAEIEELRARLSNLETRSIPVQVLAADGRVIDERRVPLGDPIQLRLVPVLPPAEQGAGKK